MEPEESMMRENTSLRWILALSIMACVVATAAGPARADVVLASDFTGVDVSDDTAPYTATNITWDTVTGIVAPVGELTFVDPTGGDIDGFHNVADEISVDYNLPQQGPWSTSILLELDTATTSIDLTTLDFNWRVTNNAGASSTPQSKTDTWTAEIIGSTSGSLGTAVIGPSAPGSPLQLRSIDMSEFTLDNTETYTLTLRIDGYNWGHNASIQDISLSGDITAGAIGDANGDGVVNAADYITIKENLGAFSGGGANPEDGDLDKDGDVDWDDLQVLIGGLNSGGGAAVPEPASMALLALGALAIIRKRRGA